LIAIEGNIRKDTTKKALEMRYDWNFVGVAALIRLPSVQSQIKTALGTSNGYDVGGTAAMCYRSYIDKPNATDTDGSNYTAIELLNDGLFDTAAKEEGGVTLMKSVRDRMVSSSSHHYLYIRFSRFWLR
jgi:hypothetical protein